jgi:hypothetical protein
MAAVGIQKSSAALQEMAEALQNQADRKAQGLKGTFASDVRICAIKSLNGARARPFCARN